MNEKPADRWKQLSAAVAGFHSRGWDRRRDAAAFALTLERELRSFIGSPDRLLNLRPIRFLSYTPGYAPIADRFEPADSAMEAVGVDQDGFSTFGLGLTLEIGEATEPRYPVYWLVRINTQDAALWICEVRLGELRRFELRVEDCTFDLTPVIEWIFRALLDRLDAINRPQQAVAPVGFDLGK